MVLDALKNYVGLATSLTEVTRQRATEAAKALVASGGVRAGSVGTLAEDLLTVSRSNREAMTALARFEVERGLTRVGLARADQVEALTTRLATVEARLRALEANQ